MWERIKEVWKTEWKIASERLTLAWKSFKNVFITFIKDTGKFLWNDIVILLSFLIAVLESVWIITGEAIINWIKKW